MMVVIALNSYAQTESAHLSFKGVPIDGTLDEYVSEMEKKGFELVTTENGTAILVGDFAAYKNCTIGVSTLKQRDLVSKIAVIFPSNENWQGVSTDYQNLKDMLKEKYGKPSKVIEEFQGLVKPTDDDYRMHELTMDRCKYITKFETPKGDIQLSIAHEGLRKAFVVLAYFDKINSNIIRAEAMDDL